MIVSRARCLWAVLALAAACDKPPEPVRASPVPPRESELPPATADIATGAATAPAPPRRPERVAVEGKAMGTHISIASFTTATEGEEQIKPKLDAAFAEIRRLESLMTTWREDSEISQINANAGKKAVKVSAETLAVIQKSVWISGLSEGVFDITFEAMHGVWRFDEDHDEKVPKPADVEAKRKLIDYKQIEIDAAASTVKLKKPGMRMSLGGIAKGYAVDAASHVLDKEGMTSYFVQAGGDLYVKGRKPDGSPWKVGVRDPRGKDSGDFFAMLEVEDRSFSTAGDYERTFVKDGKRYHHIIDPRTGYPATASRSVTIWAKDAFTADAVDDAVFILGPEKGLKLVESLEGCGAVIVDDHNKVWVSSRIKEKLKVLRDPTDGI